MQDRQSGRKMYTPNYRLREERERLGLTHQDVADRIQLPDPHTVSRWERGMFSPQPHYRQRLCQLFGKNAEELGFLKDRSADRKAEVSPVADAPATLWNVPPPLHSFVGREQDITAICDLLGATETRLLNLTGPGGVGKTSLSIEVAHKMRTFFDNGVCFISLAAITDPLLVLPAIAQALALPESTARPVIEQVKQLLYNKTFLLILDNFEQIVVEAPALEDLLFACQGLKVLVTSREVLHLQMEQEFLLAPLAVPDLEHLPTPEVLMQSVAVALFVQRARSHLPAFQLTPENARTVAEICVRLDGLPLALELAATRVKLLPLPALLAQLSQGLHLLRSDLRTLPQRQKTLYNAMSWSYDLLDEQERWLFRRLAIFSGGCTLEAAEAILNPGRQLDLLQSIASLIDKSLVQQRERDDLTPCFVMLETLREYGLDCLHRLGEREESLYQHAIYYLTLVEQAGPYLSGPLQTQWLALLDQERENLRAALAWLIQTKKTQLALRFCEVFGKFCGLRGYWVEEWRCLQDTLALPQTDEAKAIRAKVLRRAGHLAYRFRDLVRARVLQEESVVLSRELGDIQNLAGSLSTLAWIFYRQRDIASATRLLSECVVVAREAGNKWALANTLDSLGRLRHSQGDTVVARRLLDESIAIAREVEDKEALARILTTRVLIAIAEGDVALAQSFAQESRTLAYQLDTRPLIALTLASIGHVALAQGEYAHAARCFEERIVMAQALGDAATAALMHLYLEDVALTQMHLGAVPMPGRLAQSVAAVQKSLSFFREQGDNSNIAVALSILGNIYYVQRALQEAKGCYREACLLDQEIENNRGIGRHLIGLAMIAGVQGENERSAYLFGLVDAHLQLQNAMHPVQRQNYERMLAYIRTQLGEQVFLAQWSQGSAISLRKAIQNMQWS